MVSRKLTITGTVAACAACCAPLIVPVVWPVLAAAGLVGAGGIGGVWLAGLSLDVILCLGIAFAALASGAVWLRQWRKQARVQMQVPDLSEGAQCDLQSCGQHRNQKLEPIRPGQWAGSTSGCR